MCSFFAFGESLRVLIIIETQNTQHTFKVPNLQKHHADYSRGFMCVLTFWALKTPDVRNIKKPNMFILVYYK